MPLQLMLFTHLKSMDQMKPVTEAKLSHLKQHLKFVYFIFEVLLLLLLYSLYKFKALKGLAEPNPPVLVDAKDDSITVNFIYSRYFFVTQIFI
jgi:hypothetical protein